MPKRRDKMSDNQRKAMWARKSQNAMNSDLSKRAADVRPYSAENHSLWMAGGSRRFDIEGLDTPMIKGDKPKPKPVSVPSIKEKALGPKEEKRAVVEIDDFYKNYPVDKISTPPELFEHDEVNRSILLVLYGNKRGDAKDIRAGTLDETLSISVINKHASILAKKGYIGIKDNGGEDVIYTSIEGGYAKYVADTKGDYADILYGNEKINKPAAIKDANAVRETSIDGLKRTVIYNDNEYKSAIARYKEVKAMSDARDDGRKYTTNHLLKNAKKYKKASDDARANILAFEKDEVVLHGGTKKLQNDIDFVMKEYFDIDPYTLKNNKLNLGYSKMGGAGGYLATSGTRSHREYTLRVDDLRYRKADVKTNERYVDVLIHELTHWLRKADAQRAYTIPILNDMGARSKDTDTEEKETVMEVGARIGKMAPSGRKGYYHYLKSGDENAGQYDNKILTISPKQTSDKSLAQVGEDLEMRKNATLISRLKLRGRSEWVDMFYESENGTHYQVYNPVIPKNFNPRNIAKQIDMVDGIAGNETISEWRDGKKYTVIKREA